MKLRDDDGVYYKHADDLTPEVLRDRVQAEEGSKGVAHGEVEEANGIPSPTRWAALPLQPTN